MAFTCRWMKALPLRRKPSPYIWNPLRPKRSKAADGKWWSGAGSKKVNERGQVSVWPLNHWWPAMYPDKMISVNLPWVRRNKEQFHWASFQWLIYSPGTKKAWMKIFRYRFYTQRCNGKIHPIVLSWIPNDLEANNRSRYLADSHFW